MTYGTKAEQQRRYQEKLKAERQHAQKLKAQADADDELLKEFTTASARKFYALSDAIMGAKGLTWGERFTAINLLEPHFMRRKRKANSKPQKPALPAPKIIDAD